MSTSLPGRFGHVDLEDLDLLEAADAEDEELGSFDSALAAMPRSDPPPARSTPPEPDVVG
jgi:hypothetical protein